jgi:hypothetical protein
MFTKETQEKIAAVARWMDAVNVPAGTENAQAKGAVRAICGLVRLTGGDMSRVEAIFADYLARVWRATGCEQVKDMGMAPLFTEAEVPLSATCAAQEMHEIRV